MRDRTMSPSDPSTSASDTRSNAAEHSGRSENLENPENSEQLDLGIEISDTDKTNAARETAPYGWMGSVGEFLKISETDWLEQMGRNYKRLYQQQATQTQRQAWLDSYAVMRSQLAQLVKSRSQSTNQSTGWTLIFEYELPREGGRRPDLVLLTAAQDPVLAAAVGAYLWLGAPLWVLLVLALAVANDAGLSIAAILGSGAVAGVERVLLIGSWARGQADEESDIDLVVVDREDGQAERKVELRRRLGEVSRGVDLHVYRPEEVEKWRGVEASFLGHVLEEGVVLYES